MGCDGVFVVEVLIFGFGIRSTFRLGVLSIGEFNIWGLYVGS